jgi:hypothetical protein
MSGAGGLWGRLIGFPNLLGAARRSARGKRSRPEVLRFHAELGHELWELHAQLRDGTWRPGPYRTSPIREPKGRDRLFEESPGPPLPPGR